MKGSIKRLKHIATGMVFAMLCSSPLVLADDTELFLGNTSSSPTNGNPNILFILDTSGSMDGEVITQVPYDPNVVYAGSCDPNRVYWRSGIGNSPGCGTNRWFNRSALMCDDGATAIDNVGYYTDKIAQFDDRPNKRRWNVIRSGKKNRLVECFGDSGEHGDGINTSALWARNGNSFPWSTDSDDEVSWSGSKTGNTYTLYHGNWLNWEDNAATTTKDRLEVVQEVTNDLLDSVSGVNVGLMRFNDTQGGPVIHAMEDIEDARADMQATITGLDHDGWTPLSETLYEAGLYYMGEPVDYGTNGVMEAREPLNTALYDPPVNYACQKNFIVLLTDGQPTEDVDADTKIAGLSDFEDLTGRTSCDINVNPDGTTDGSCLDDMSEYLFEADLDSTLPDKQNVTTYTVGFAVDLPLLDSTATRGGGQYLLADDAVSLSTALTNIVTEILQENTTFSAPTVSVNAFNRTQNMNDLFITVFQSTGDSHWPGNLKKYRILGGQIVGEDGAAVVDPSTGFFKDTAQSFWGGIVDGAEVPLSGAASQLPDPAARKLYTFTGNQAGYSGTLNAALSSGTHEVKDGNAALTDAMLGIGLPGDPTRNDIIDWARGLDVLDDDQDNDFTDNRRVMGDPLHAKPVSIVYGGTVINPEAVVYTATNDGYLHAVDPADGSERWAFVPQEMLGRFPTLMDNAPSADKLYGLDGNVRSLVVDHNYDGIINGADKAYIFFGMRRGGDYYYALDVTNKDAPILMWVKGSDELPGLGQTWSTPFVSKVDAGSAAQNSENYVLVFGGGYDATQDNENYTTDVMGNGIYMLDAVSGNLLWRAGPDGGADTTLAAMTNSIPADVRVLDMNGDDFADRMYVGDMGGRLWRFDIFNGQNPGSLVAGGVIASLGAADLASPPTASNRRFYASPDVAPVATHHDGIYLHIGIGSGYRAHPLNVSIKDRFYSVRDRKVFAQMSQADYDAVVPVVDGDLIDITDDLTPTVSTTAPGWKLEMRNAAAPGEKVLSEARTLLGKVFFTSFSPPSGAAVSCVPGAGTNRLYVVDIADGGAGEQPDRVVELKQGGIAPPVSFFFVPEQPPGSCTGAQCEPDLIGLIGVEGIPSPMLPPFFRTFWNAAGAIPAQPPSP